MTDFGVKEGGGFDIPQLEEASSMGTHLRLGALVVGVTIAFSGAPAALANFTGTPGPPNQSCQSFEGPGGTNAPGHSGTSPGSVFNEPGFGSTSGGTGGNAYNNANAPSQYDVACFQVNQSHP